MRSEAGELNLEPQAMQLLVVLAQEPGQVHTRDELMQAVWGHLHVSEDALNRAVSRLRRRLADGPGTPEIETVPRIGYRLVLGDTPAAVVDDAPRIEPAANVAAEPAAPLVQHVRRGWRFGRFGVVASFGFVLGALSWWPALESGGSPAQINVRPLTSLEGEEQSPAFSPDGQRVAFSWRRQSESNAQIYVRALHSDELYALTAGDGDDRFPAWSPDGTEIAFERLSGSDCELMVISTLGGTERRLAPCHPESEGIAWSPDGRWLAFSPQTDSPFPTVSLLDRDTLKVKNVAALPDGVIADSDPAFSPDGKQLAFLRWRSAMVTDIYAMRLDSGELRPITDDRLEIHGFGWSGDGHSLLFSSSRGGARAIWRVGAEGGTPERVTAGNGRVGHIAASPGGRRAVYEEHLSRVDIWSMPIDGGDPKPLITSTRWTFQPRVSPDRRYIAYGSDASGATEIWISRLDGSEPRRLTNFSGPYTGRPSWSPDSRSLVFESTASGGLDLYRIDVDGGRAQRLTDDPSDDLAATWSRDGRTIYFASQRTGTWQLWAYELDGGSEHQLTQDGGYYAQQSDDGLWLYFSKRGEAGLWRLPVAGGTAEQVYDRIGPQGTSLWALNGDGVVYMTIDRPSTGSLQRLDFSTGEVRHIADVPRLFYLSGLTMIDEAHVAYSKTEMSEIDLMVVETVSPPEQTRTAWFDVLNRSAKPAQATAPVPGSVRMER